jgi:hypothetical protein
MTIYHKTFYTLGLFPAHFRTRKGQARRAKGVELDPNKIGVNRLLRGRLSGRANQQHL